MDSNIETATPLVTPPPASPTHLPTTENPKKSKTKLIFLILVPILLVLIAAGVFSHKYYNNQKKEIIASSEKQITHLQDIIITQENIKNLLKGEMPMRSDIKVLGISDGKLTGDVKGLEDTEIVRQERETKRLIKDILSSLKELSDENEKVKQTSSKIFIQDTPVAETSSYINESEPLLNYLYEASQINIDAVSIGYELGTVLRDCISRDADEICIQNYEKSLDEMEKLKEKIEIMEISGLNEELKQEHEKFIESIDEEFDPFYDIYDALKEKDGVKLLNTLTALTSTSDSAVESSKSDYISFWEDNETMNKPQNLKKSWENFADRLK